MFFNIEFYQPYMTPEDLLRVEPEVLAKLILHKRERIAQSLPKTIEIIAEQKHAAEKLTRQSRVKKEDLEPKVHNLLKERAAVVNELTGKLHSYHQNNEKTSPNDDIIQQLLDQKTTSQEFTEQLENIIQTYQQQGGDIKELDYYNSSIKANNALAELINDFDAAKNHWSENEENRRKIESKFTKMSSKLKHSDTSIQYWQEKLSTSLDDLLLDAKRVAAGGLSSRQILRNNKHNNAKRGR